MEFGRRRGKLYHRHRERRRTYAGAEAYGISKALNDSNNTKNKENGYFRDYFQTKLKVGWTCDRCGASISTKANKSRRYLTQKCKSRQLDRMQDEARDKILK